jgi:hypothetical protein
MCVYKQRVTERDRDYTQTHTHTHARTHARAHTHTHKQASMVFVHVQNHKAAPVNQIKAETEEDRLRVAEGEAANERRKIDRKMSLKAAPPTVEETVIVFVFLFDNRPA